MVLMPAGEKGSYSSRTDLNHMLNPKFDCSGKRIYPLMRRTGIFSARCRAYRVTTNLNHGYKESECRNNLVGGGVGFILLEGCLQQR